MIRTSDYSKDYILKNDLKHIASNLNILHEIRDSTILITGSTGLIGSGIVKTLLYANQMQNLNISVIALCRSFEKAKIVFRDFLGCYNFKIINHDILTQFNLEDKIDYIIHGASITQSKDFIIRPVETITTTVNGTQNILELALKNNIKGMVFLSSLEIYGAISEDKELINEIDYGVIDFLSLRSSYSESKRMVECLCSAYSKQYLLPVKIARLTQTFGPGVDYNDNRVFAQFAKSILENKDIVLHTMGETVKNYIYLTDAITAIFYVLIKGKNGDAYNIANPDASISIYDMAQSFINIFPEKNLKIVHELSIPEDQRGYNVTTKIRLDVRKLEQLGWKANVDLATMLKNTVLSMKERYRYNE